MDEILSQYKQLIVFLIAVLPFGIAVYAALFAVITKLRRWAKDEG